MFAPRSPDEPERMEPQECARESAPECLVSQLADAIQESSTVFLVRFPSAVPALRPAHRAEEALREALPDPCALQTFSFAPDLFAVALTPSLGPALDPMHVHNLAEMLRRTLAQESAAPEDSPQVIPLARVSSVGALQENLDALNDMLDKIVNRRLDTHFQPIIHFARAETLGYEALIRAPQTGVTKRLGQMFQAADRARLVSWLDVACQEQCLREAARLGVKGCLFLNMDAEGLSYLHEAGQSLAEWAAAMGVPPRQIVLEITERQTVEDFPRLRQYIRSLREQGFRIAVDDVGDGYSSLLAIIELQPDFIKFSRSLVRGLENSGTRRALIASMVQFARKSGIMVIAEGIETRDELAAVLDIGVHCGQGYLLGRPSDHFKPLRREMQNLIHEHLARRQQRARTLSCTVGSLARQGTPMPPDTPCEQIAARFARNPEIECLPIVEEGRIAGLVVRSAFEQAVKANPAALEGPVVRLMDRQPATIEEGASLEAASRLAAHRPALKFAHDLIVLRGDQYAGVVPVRTLLETITALYAAQEMTRRAGNKPGKVPE